MKASPTAAPLLVSQPYTPPPQHTWDEAEEFGGNATAAAPSPMKPLAIDTGFIDIVQAAHEPLPSPEARTNPPEAGARGTPRDEAMPGTTTVGPARVAEASVLADGQGNTPTTGSAHKGAGGSRGKHQGGAAGEAPANDAGATGPGASLAAASAAAGATGASHLLMPEPPSELGPAAAARLARAKETAGVTAAATSAMPEGGITVGDARGAVKEPEAETKGRAERDVTAQLDERPQPSSKILLLCKEIRKAILDRRPPDESSLVKAKPRDMAQAAGKSLQNSVTADAKGVQGQYDALDQPPAGQPASQPTPYAQPPAAVDAPEIAASGAAPDPIPAENISLDNDIAAQQQKIADAGMETEPARLVQDGPIAEARSAQGELAQQGAQEPALIAGQQQQAIQTAQLNMAELQARALEAMNSARTGAIGGRSQQQSRMVGSEEQMRDAAGKRMRDVFSTAQSEVNSLLDPLPKLAMDKWDSGVKAASTAFEESLKVVAAWIAKRHEGFVGKIRAVGDWLTGLPRWVSDEYDKAEKLFGDTLCHLLEDISRDVNAQVAACEAIIAEARSQIDALVEALPAELREWATGEAAGVNAQLDSLQAHAHQVRDDFENSLEERARGAVQEVREKVQALRDTAGGLLGRIAAAVTAFLEDPARFIINGLLSLANVPPAAFWALVDKIQAVIGDIANDPLGFATNLLAAISQGFSQFFGNIGTHLLSGFLGWLFSGLGGVGVELPTDFSLKSVVTLFLQLMGLTWARIRELLAEHLGEENVALVEQALGLVSTLIEEGPAGIFELIKKQLDPQTLVDTVITMAVDYMKDVLIKQAMVRILAMFNPVGAILAAVEAIYRVLNWVFENAARIFSLVETVVNGIADIVAGNVGGMASAIETALAGLITPVIGFLADYLSMGDLPQKIASFIGGMQEKVLGIVDKVIGFLAEKARTLMSARRLGGTEPMQATPGEEDPAGAAITPIDAVNLIKGRANVVLKSIAGEPNEKAGAIMKSFYERESTWVENNVRAKDGRQLTLLVIPRGTETAFWVDIKLNPKASSQRNTKPGAGGKTTVNGRPYFGMFHGSGEPQRFSLRKLDLTKLRKNSDSPGQGLELGSGLYLAHYFRDAKGYAFRRKKGNPHDGWIYKINVPEEMLKRAEEPQTPDTAAGDKKWDQVGDVVKGQWLHIDRNDWKAGYQWVIKTEARLRELKLVDVLRPYKAADVWGRGANIEFPEDFRKNPQIPDKHGPKETYEDVKALVALASNPHEPTKPQEKGVGD